MSPIIAAAFSEFTGLGGVILTAIGGILSLILFYVWLLLPLTISRKFDESLAEQRKQTALLERIASQNGLPTVHPPSVDLNGSPAAQAEYKIPGLQ